MPGGVEVNISNTKIILVLNAPGGGVFDWRDDVAEEITRLCRTNSPVNKVANAMHRGGKVGTFKASWKWDRLGSNGHNVQATIHNIAGHAMFVEFGRTGSGANQRFSWIKHKPPGSIRTHMGTGPRTGWHTLRDMTNDTMPKYMSGYTPLI